MSDSERIENTYKQEASRESMEWIKGPAIKYRGKIFSGEIRDRHEDVIESVSREHPEFRPADKMSYRIGFLTNSGRFVDRVDATEIALHANQVKDITRLRGRDPFVIGSGDLTPPKDAEK